ncbi:multidrug MFS transporter [Oceanicola sp. 22II-s10i]|nr:multidrug MFS transporter [Oceanicola sp. 22II-s10i]
MSQTPEIRFLDRRTPPRTVTLVVLTGLSAMSMTLFLPSLPRIASYFDAPYALVQLAIAGYMAANAVLQIFIGPLADKFGRRPVLLIGLAIFCLATLGCLFAPTIGVFLFFRTIQAAIVVGLALGRAIVRDMYPADEAAARIGYVTMGMALVPMVAPAFGGWLDETVGWQGPFWMLFILGLLVFALIWADLGETGPQSDRTILAQFAEYPELLRSPRFWGYCMASALSSGAFFAYLGGSPYVAGTVFGLSPTQFGLWTAMPGVGYFMGNFMTGLVAARLGINRMVVLGTTTTALGIAGALAVSYAGYGGPIVFFGGMFFVAWGNGMTMPSATSGMLSVRPHLAGTASGLGGAMMVGFGAALSATAGLVLGPGRDETALMWLMISTAVSGLFVILMVVRRERRLGLGRR